MKKIDEINNALEQEDIARIKKLLNRILRNWYWFILSGIVCVVLALYMTKITPPTFETHALMLVKGDKSSSDLVMEDLLMSHMSPVEPNVKDYIGMLTSYSMNRRVLENLDWATSWYKEEEFRDVELYGDEPFVITMKPEEKNLCFVPIHVAMVDSDHYRVVIDELFDDYYSGGKASVNITMTKKFGEPFESEYFNFTVWKKQDFPKGDFYFMFNDSRSQVNRYTKSINITESKERSHLINISLTDSNPQKAIDYLNELCNVFIQFGLIEKNKKSANTVKFIDEQLSGVIDTLEVAGRNFSSFRSRNQIVNLSQEGDIIVQKLVKLESEKSEEQTRLDYYIDLQKYLNDKEKMKEMISPSVVGIMDPSLANLVRALSDLYSRREVISYTVKDKNPSYILINNEIDLTTQKLKENLSNLINNSKILLSNLTRRIENLNTQLQKFPKTEQELMNIKRSFDLNNELYTYLLKKRAEAAITHASNVPDTQILDQAGRDTTYQIGPSLVFNLALGIFGGIAIPFIIIMISAYFNDRLSSAEEIEQLSSLQIVGNLIQNGYKKQLLPAVNNPRSAVAEAFRELRTNLRFLTSKDNLKVISINSVIPREGKTFTAANLASMIAINSMKVLLIDCDMRKPSIHAHFGCENSIGLSTYLISKNTRKEIIQKTKIDNLYLISAGPVPPNPSEMLETGKLEQLIKEAKEEFDYIIIDNSPLSLVSDGIIISQFTDVNLFVLRQDYSTKGEVKFVNHMNAAKSMKNAGIILNGIQLGKHAHEGYYGAKYSYKKSYGHRYYFEKN